MPLWNLFLPRHYYLISCLFTELVNVLTWQCNFVDDDDMIFICFLFAQSSNIIKYFKAIHLTRDMWSCLPTTHQGVHSILSYIILFGLSPANVLINFLNFEFPFQVMISSLIASLKEVNSENAANHTTCNAVSHHLRRSLRKSTDSSVEGVWAYSNWTKTWSSKHEVQIRNKRHWTVLYASLPSPLARFMYCITCRDFYRMIVRWWGRRRNNHLARKRERIIYLFDVILLAALNLPSRKARVFFSVFFITTRCLSSQVTHCLSRNSDTTLKDLY